MLESLQGVATLFSASLFCVVVAGCPASGSNDDDFGDDDDAVANDDDASDDDDGAFAYESVTLRGDLLAIQEGDDDDDVADDDDSAAAGSPGDDDDSATGNTARDEARVEGTFVLDYWRNIDAQLRECEQTIAWTGTVEFASSAVSTCAGCTGVLTIDSASVEDVSNRAVEPAACDPADLAVVGRDLGQLLTASGPGAAGGGFLQLALMDTATAIGLGVQPSQSGGLDLQSQAEQIAATGNLMTHVGFVSSAGGTFFDEINFDKVAGASGTSETWSAFWFVFRPSSQGTALETDLSGAYQLGSFWILQ